MCEVAGGMRWRVRYAADLVSTSQIRLDEGVLWLRLEAMTMVLLDADGKTVDARFLKDGERIDIAKGQGFFYIPDLNVERQSRDRNHNIIVTITEGSALTKDIEAELSVYVGQGWRCSANFFAPQRFVMRMPNPREIERALFLEHVKLKKCGVSVKFSPWSDDLESEGLVEVAWVKIGRIPINKRCNKTVAYVGGLVGITLEVDMSTLNRLASVRAKIGCRHVDQIPTSAEGVLGSRFYKFTYEVEEVLVKNTVTEETAVPVARDDASKQNLTPKRKREHHDNEKDDSYSESSGANRFGHSGNNTPETHNDLKDVQVTFSSVVRKSLSYADVVTNNWQVSELEGEANPNMKISCDYVVLSPETDHNVDVIPTPPIASEAATRFSKRNTCGMQEKVEDRARRLASKRDLEGNPQLRNNSFSVLSDAELISRASNMGVIIPDGSFACIDVLRELEQVREELDLKKKTSHEKQDDMFITNGLGHSTPVSLEWLDQDETIFENESITKSKKKNNRKPTVKISRPVTRSQKKKEENEGGKYWGMELMEQELLAYYQLL
ncbi:hypothetical protein D1007_42300 [Hordeum vulgare]|nr:hypothetical protein D1007_42300 [Hordeum vulgare]